MYLIFFVSINKSVMVFSYVTTFWLMQTQQTNAHMSCAEIYDVTGTQISAAFLAKSVARRKWADLGDHWDKMDQML